MPAGAAKLDFSYPGFKNQRTSVNISNSYRNEADAKLSVGSVSEMAEVSGENALMTASPSMLNAALARQNSDAQGKEVGDFFQYDLGERITLAKNQSALVPILNALEPQALSTRLKSSATNESELRLRSCSGSWSYQRPATNSTSG